MFLLGSVISLGAFIFNGLGDKNDIGNGYLIRQYVLAVDIYKCDIPENVWPSSNDIFDLLKDDPRWNKSLFEDFKRKAIYLRTDSNADSTVPVLIYPSEGFTRCYIVYADGHVGIGKRKDILRAQEIFKIIDEGKVLNSKDLWFKN